MITRIVTIVFLTIACSAWATAGGEEVQPRVIYLVRHAEKQTHQGGDPALTESGRARARHLAYILAQAGIDSVYSSDYRRTRQTAEPLAKKLGLAVQLYDARALDDLARQLRRGGGRSLVVGHSNTTPRLVELLGGEGGAPIDEQREYDRLYIVILDRGRVTTLLQRFGPASNE